MEVHGAKCIHCAGWFRIHLEHDSAVTHSCEALGDRALSFFCFPPSKNKMLMQFQEQCDILLSLALKIDHLEVFILFLLPSKAVSFVLLHILTST